MATHAYALRESVDPEGFDGAIAVGEGLSLNVGELLRDNNGVYVTDDPQEIEVLDGYSHVKRVSLDDAEQAHKSRRSDAPAKSQDAGTQKEQ